MLSLHQAPLVNDLRSRGIEFSDQIFKLCNKAWKAAVDLQKTENKLSLFIESMRLAVSKMVATHKELTCCIVKHGHRGFVDMQPVIKIVFDAMDQKTVPSRVTLYKQPHLPVDELTALKQCLVHLELEGCDYRDMHTVDDVFADFPRLTHFSASRCDALQKLPEAWKKQLIAAYESGTLVARKDKSKYYFEISGQLVVSLDRCDALDNWVHDVVPLTYFHNTKKKQNQQHGAQTGSGYQYSHSAGGQHSLSAGASNQGNQPHTAGHPAHNARGHQGSHHAQQGGHAHQGMQHHGKYDGAGAPAADDVTNQELLAARAATRKAQLDAERREADRRAALDLQEKQDAAFAARMQNSGGGLDDSNELTPYGAPLPQTSSPPDATPKPPNPVQQMVQTGQQAFNAAASYLRGGNRNSDWY